MNISPDGVSVRFKTEPKELFEAEKSGAKPNTVRIIDAYEAGQLRRNPPTKIVIQHQQEIFLRTITHIYFDFNVLGKVIVVISWTNEGHHHLVTRGAVSHGPGDHTQSLVGPHSVPVEPGPHNLSADYVPEVPTTPPICKCTNCIRGMREEGESSSRIYLSAIPIAKTMRCPDCDGDLLKSKVGEFGKCAICQALFRVEEGEHEPTSESPTKLDELAPVLLPRTLIHDLGRFRQDGSHADFIRKLLLEHLNKLVEEGGPMHD